MCTHKGLLIDFPKFGGGATPQEGSLTLALLLSVSPSPSLTLVHTDYLTISWFLSFLSWDNVNVSVTQVSYTQVEVSLRKVPWSKMYQLQYIHIANRCCQLFSKNGHINLYSRVSKSLGSHTLTNTRSYLFFFLFQFLPIWWVTNNIS